MYICSISLKESCYGEGAESNFFHKCMHILPQGTLVHSFTQQTPIPSLALFYELDEAINKRDVFAKKKI